MNEDAALRIRDVAAYLRVSHQRGAQMYAEGKLPEPERVDGIGPLWKPATIERWAKREWWGTRRWRKRLNRRERPRSAMAVTACANGRLEQRGFSR